MSDKNKKIGIIIIGLGILLAGILTAYLILSFKPELAGIVSKKEGGTKPPEPVIVSDDFDQAIAQLDTSQKLVNYLNSNFSFEPKEGNIALTPQEFFEKRKGNASDFAIFASYVLWKHRYEAGIIRYKYNDNINTVIVFKDKDLPKTIIFTSEGVEMYAHGFSFEEMFQKEEERLKAKITEYAVSYWTDVGELWPEEWSKREW